MWVTRVSINNPIFATMMMAAIVVLGTFSYNKLKIQQFPNINLPTIVVTTIYPNASPKSVENDVTEKIENAVNTIGGIDTITSKSYQGKSLVVVKFNLDTDASEDEEDVREQVSAIESDFNDNVETPSVTQVDPDSQPVVSISVSSETQNLQYISTLVDNVIIKSLEDVDGVGETDISGSRTRQINIHVIPTKLNYYKLSVNDIISALENDSQNFPTGTIKKTITDTNVQIESSFKRVEDFNQVVVAKRGEQSVFLNQVATIEDGMADLDSVALINGAPAVTIDIIKSNDANTVEVAKELKKRIIALQTEIPSDVEIKLIKDNAKGIQASVNNVKETIIEGAILTVMVVFLFLSSWRSTVITALTLPISVIGTFMAIYSLGFTLNNLTLMALSLSIGILIDDAIVVRENISRHILKGKTHYQAALDGTQEIGLAVLATTSTLVAVFLPVAYMEGIIGRMFYQFGITVSVSVLISLLVSYSVDPMLSSIWYDPHLEIEKQPKLLQRFSLWRDEKFDEFNDWYQKILNWCLLHRKKTLTITLVVFCSSFLLTKFIGKEFIPSADLGEVTVLVTAPEGSSVDYTASKVKQIQAILLKMSEVDYSYATVNSRSAQGKNEAIVYVELVGKGKRKLSAQELIPIIRNKLEKMAGLEIMVGMTDSFGRAKRSIQVSIRGTDLNRLSDIASQVERDMYAVGGFVDIDNGLNVDQPVVNLKIRRQQASDLGITPLAIYNVVQPLLSGYTVGTWLAPDENNYDIVVRLAEKDRELIHHIKNLYIASSTVDDFGAPIMVPLSQLVDVTTDTMASEIDHRNLLREVVVSGNVEGITEGDASIKLYSKIDDIPLPKGYTFTSAGNDKNMVESAGYAASALGLAIIFIYLILASQFASFTQPIVIMASLPLSLIGVFLALFITGSTLNMFSVIGCIMLMGLVTKNAILLVDFINLSMRNGVDRSTAIIDAGRVRMRPILMTTFAMVFGMVPLALGIGEGAEQRMSMAQAIIGGIITSTVLTLVIIPIVYTYIDDWSQAMLKKFKQQNELAQGTKDPHN